MNEDYEYDVYDEHDWYAIHFPDGDNTDAEEEETA
jgi:hypothetical protein